MTSIICAKRWEKSAKLVRFDSILWTSSKSNELWISQATRFLHNMWFCFQFLTFYDVNSYSQNFPNKCQRSEKQMSNSRKTRRVINQHFYQPPYHSIDCKPYDKYKVTEKFVATPGILNLKARNARNFSDFRMLQGDDSQCCNRLQLRVTFGGCQCLPRWFAVICNDATP